VQQAGSKGLAPCQINSVTKHMLEKLHKSCQAEADKEACKVMSGFSKDEDCFVERKFLKPPWPIVAGPHQFPPSQVQNLDASA
jgi:hypothetical protein